MMQAEVIDLLSGKGKFPTEQALVLAEAIDMAIERSQLVTVPILDGRLAAVNARFDRVDARFAEMEARFQKVDARFAEIEVRFQKVDARFDAVDARFNKMDARFDKIEARFEKMEARFGQVEARIDALEARMDTRMERWAVKLVIAMLVSQTALGPIGVAALDSVRRALATLVH
jgi:hypothetical protein